MAKATKTKKTVKTDKTDAMANLNNKVVTFLASLPVESKDRTALQHLQNIWHSASELILDYPDFRVSAHRSLMRSAIRSIKKLLHKLDKQDKLAITKAKRLAKLEARKQRLQASLQKTESSLQELE